jgi:aromatic-L-amino-acid/L-tryptophan decarboxylase
MDASKLASSDDARPALAGDMHPDELKRIGHQFIDWIAEYLSHPENYPVLSQVAPGDLTRSLPASPPAFGERMETMLEDVERYVVPGVTHWNHPAFFGYFSSSGSGPGILGELLSAAFNVNAMLWRTSPSATELEEVTLSWLRQMIGLPTEFSGIIYDTASISTLCALAAAREAVTEIRVREEGLSGPVRLRLYESEHGHSSVDKAALTLGIGQAGVRKISADAEFRMDARELARAIGEDRANGWRPFCVVATVGTTSTTSIDPVRAIAEICRREGLWLHVDAAYGGSAAVIPEMRWVLDGCDGADSLVVNPHKWLFVPMDLSALYCRKMEVLRRAFSLVPEYLRTSEPDEVRNYMDYGPQLGRRFRALKLWFVIRYFGVEGVAARIGRHIDLAHELARWVDDSPDFERLAPVPFSTVCFRATPAGFRDESATRTGQEGSSHADDLEERLNRLNEQLMDDVNREGKVFLSHTKLTGRFTLRIAIGNIRTTREHVSLAWDRLNAALERIRLGSSL